jgi:hypothetical protein
VSMTTAGLLQFWPLSEERTAMMRPPLGQAVFGWETWPYPE